MEHILKQFTNFGAPNQELTKSQNNSVNFKQ